MEISPNALRKDAVQLYKEADKLFEQIEHDEGLTHLKRTELMISLLQTKSQSLNTLVLLNEPSKPRSRPRGG